MSLPEEDELTARHREWMRREAETAEFPNAWLKERFGVRKFRVRGLSKVRAELLWAMLAYNVAQWVRLVWREPMAVAARFGAVCVHRHPEGKMPAPSRARFRSERGFVYTSRISEPVTKNRNRSGGSEITCSPVAFAQVS